MLGLRWLAGLVRRRPARIAAATVGVAAAVALLASIGSFLSASKATMTRRAAADVAVDWQVEVQPGADPQIVLDGVRASSRVKLALPVAFASSTGFEADTGGSTQTTGPALVLGIPDSYRANFPTEVRDLVGAGHGVLLAQQTAANLHAAPGDQVSIGRAGLPPFTVAVDGVVDLPQIDSLFQKVGAPAGSQPQAPPDNVVLLPEPTWHEGFDPLAATRPDLVRTQVHAALAHDLPSDPAAAYSRVTGEAHNLESRLTGSALVGDNLAAALSSARSDALYAQVLFLFLGLPGAVLAGLLTASVAGAGAERRRREQALLRARGATGSRLLGLGVAEAIAVGLVGSALGLVGAVVVGKLSFGTGSFGATRWAAFGWSVGAALVGFVIAVATIAVPTWRDSRRLTVVGARRSVGRPSTPLWMRFGLDFVLLAGAVVVFWLTGRGGYALVLAPEGVPTVSVSYWAFVGPALLWIGGGLLAWRSADLVLGHGSRILGWLARPLAGRLAPTVAASMSRQRRLVARALVMVALTVSFAASTAVFNATYRQQTAVDALLTNGADVTVTEPGGIAAPPADAGRLASVPGVRSVEPLQHRFAYVGADLQDLYGVRPSTVVGATKLQDAYFAGGTARQLVDRLATRPDGILVSAETVKDFQLSPGDLVTLRLQNSTTKSYTPVPFHYVGVVKEFPTAPRDSFLVANADYVARTTGSAAVGAYLLDTQGNSPSAVAQRVRSVVGPSAQVQDLSTTRRVVGSSLTAVDLAGLTRVELAFALVLAAAATGLLLALGLAERRRTFAIAAALGARPRQLGGFVWTEAAFVTLGGLGAGALGGWLLSEMLVKVLSGVFDPPPVHLGIPWGYLGTLAGVAVVAVSVAAAGAIRAARRPAMGVLKDL